MMRNKIRLATARFMNFAFGVTGVEVYVDGKLHKILRTGDVLTIEHPKYDEVRLEVK